MADEKKGWGGARPGAGRKKKPADPLAGIGTEGFDPRPALEMTARGLLEPSAAQLRALVALMPYVHTKKGEGGKKDQAADRAKKAAGGGRFGATPPPLKLVGRA